MSLLSSPSLTQCSLYVKLLLTNCGCLVLVVLVDGDYREPLLQGPGVQHCLDVHVLGQGAVLVPLHCQVVPQVILLSSIKLLIVEVVCQSLGQAG